MSDIEYDTEGERVSGHCASIVIDYMGSKWVPLGTPQQDWAPNERQAVLDCINLYGDETLHSALDAAGLFPGAARPR